MREGKCEEVPEDGYGYRGAPSHHEDHGSYSAAAAAAEKAQLCPQLECPSCSNTTESQSGAKTWLELSGLPQDEAGDLGLNRTTLLQLSNLSQLPRTQAQTRENKTEDSQHKAFNMLHIHENATERQSEASKPGAKTWLELSGLPQEEAGEVEQDQSKTKTNGTAAESQNRAKTWLELSGLPQDKAGDLGLNRSTWFQLSNLTQLAENRRRKRDASKTWLELSGLQKAEAGDVGLEKTVTEIAAAESTPSITPTTEAVEESTQSLTPPTKAAEESTGPSTNIQSPHSQGIKVQFKPKSLAAIGHEIFESNIGG